MTFRLNNATYVDPVSRRTAPNIAISVRDGIIEEVIPDGWLDDAINAEGRYLVPGLMDMHIHLHARQSQGPSSENPVGPKEDERYNRAGLLSRLHSFVYCGVTSVYDAGNDADMIFGLRAEERAGQLISPRIFCTGNLLTCPGGHGHSSAVEIAQLPTDRPHLDAFLARDPDLVKITYDEHNWGVRPLIPILDQATLRAIVDRSHETRHRVTVHVSSELRAREAVACGADALAHPVIQSPVTEDFVWLLARKQIPVVSTLAIGDRYSRLAEAPEFLDEPLYHDCVDEEERYRLKAAESERQRQNRWAAWMKVMTPVAQENLRMLVDAGGIVVTGTDLSLGPDYHRELYLLQQAGIAPIEVIRSATWNGARFLGREAELGSVEVGKRADFLLVAKDPTVDVRNLKDIWMVVKGGSVLDRSKRPSQAGGVGATTR